MELDDAPLRVDIISKPTNAHQRVKIYCTHSVHSTRFGQSRGHQESAL
jgi:hypothetical protein